MSDSTRRHPIQRGRKSSSSTAHPNLPSRSRDPPGSDVEIIEIEDSPPPTPKPRANRPVAQRISPLPNSAAPPSETRRAVKTANADGIASGSGPHPLPLRAGGSGTQPSVRREVKTTNAVASGSAMPPPPNVPSRKKVVEVKRVTILPPEPFIVANLPQTHPSNNNTGRTPTRARFGQQKSERRSQGFLSPNSPHSVRKATSSPSALGRALPLNPSETVRAAKNTSPIVPIWQGQDEIAESTLKRSKKEDVPLRRISSNTGRRRTAVDPDAIHLDANDPDRAPSRIGPSLRLWKDGKFVDPGSESDSDSDVQSRPQSRRSDVQSAMSVDLRSERPPAGTAAARKSSVASIDSPSSSSGSAESTDVDTRVVVRKTVSGRKAARKFNYRDTSSSSSSSSDESMRSPSAPASDNSQEDQLDPEEYEPPLPQPTSHPILVLDSPPEITIPLPQIKAEPEEVKLDSVPSDVLVTALEACSLSVRLQALRRLPFLRRNVKQGFFSRCRSLQVPIYRGQESMSLLVIYESVDNLVYRTRADNWSCPCCSLFGVFETLEMLKCHMEWDHTELVCTWKVVEESNVVQSWEVHILIPEQDSENSNLPRPLTSPRVSKTEIEEETYDTSYFRQRRQSVLPAHFSSPLPYVSLSSPSQTMEMDAGMSIVTKQEEHEDLSANLDVPVVVEKLPPRLPPLSRVGTEEPVSPSARGRFTTTSSLDTEPIPSAINAGPTAAADAIPAAYYADLPRHSRPVTPPPRDNPLGPSAQRPYLPAEPDYPDGQAVYYSCRPQGECLFDLLGTLTMKPFGVLGWEVLEREDEIYDSDDVREEFKVIQAIWARWILLNRTLFIANYLEGAKTFIDKNWRIIHRAAGWAALRDWFLVLIANQFLTPHEVAQALKHYEERTNMSSWYD